VDSTLPPERLLTARETADHLGISPGTLLRWTHEGVVPTVKLPSGTVRYCPKEIAAWLDSRSTGSE
jgi:excisionase family DNA binding protein